MKKKRIYLILTAAGFLLLLAVGTVLAFSTASVDWWVFSSGGGPSSGGNISMNDTIGQPVIGPSIGGDVSLQAGYWVSGSEVEEAFTVYLPLVLR